MYRHLFKPVSILPLVIFRGIFGLLAFLEVIRIFYKEIVRYNFIDPPFTFSYFDVPWLQPLPGNGMYWYFAIIGLLGIFMMVGFLYRISAIVLFLLWGGIYFMQKSYNSNYYYLILILVLLLIFVPAHSKYSIDSILFKRIRRDKCPQWCIWIFTFQVSLLYFFAGFAKLNSDWLSGRTMAALLKYKTNLFLVGPFLAQKWFQLFLTYAGLFFDILIAPFFLWRKTRFLAFSVSTFFHLFNSYVFRVGLFPYMSMGLSVFFFKANEVERFISKYWKIKKYNIKGSFIPQKKVVIYPLIVWVIFQLYMPIRHLFYDGFAGWNEEGNRHSWRIMYRIKGGRVNFLVKNPETNKSWIVDPKSFLSERQLSIVATKPDVCWHFVQFLKKHYKETQGLENLEIYAEGWVSLNRRKPQPLYNPKINLAKVEWERFSHSTWLNPEPWKESKISISKN